jgi:hypothetical protein
MNINLHIERLVLDGLPIEGSQAAHVQAAVETELTRLLTENGLTWDFQLGIASPVIHASSLQLALGSKPAQLGRQIAHSVYSGLGNSL